MQLGHCVWTVRSRMDRKQPLRLVLRRIQSIRKKDIRNLGESRHHSIPGLPMARKREESACDSKTFNIIMYCSCLQAATVAESSNSRIWSKVQTGKGMEKCGRLFIRKWFALISPTWNLSSTECLPFTSIDSVDFVCCAEVRVPFRCFPGPSLCWQCCFSHR